LCAFDALVGDARASVQIRQRRDRAIHPREEGHQVRDRLRHLYERAQRLQVARQRQVVLFRQFEDRLRADAAIGVAVQVNERGARWRHALRLFHCMLSTEARNNAPPPVARILHPTAACPLGDI
jgi:hypothetical protein